MRISGVGAENVLPPPPKSSLSSRVYWPGGSPVVENIINVPVCCEPPRVKRWKVWFTAANDLMCTEYSNVAPNCIVALAVSEDAVYDKIEL